MDGKKRCARSCEGMLSRKMQAFGDAKAWPAEPWSIPQANVVEGERSLFAMVQNYI